MKARPAARSKKINRLVCVVEGDGDAKAVPNLCSHIRNHLEAWDWFVDDEPVKQPRGKLVDESSPSPNRRAREDGLVRAVTLALRRPADAVLVLCDADRDCPAAWGPHANTLLRSVASGGAVMACVEYEAWLLCSIVGSATTGGRPIEGIRNAKGELAKHFLGYKPAVHQLRLTQSMNLDLVWRHSESFDKLVRTLAAIFRVKAVRPTA